MHVHELRRDKYPGVPRRPLPKFAASNSEGRKLSISLLTDQAMLAKRHVVSDSMPQVLQTQVCVAGGGPAGLVHGLLLARAGIPVVVLEKHNDFLRDFRGDTVHPSTLRIMAELGLIDELLRIPHTKIKRVAFDVDGSLRTFGNFSALKWLGFRQPYIALMPQWDFLDFLAEKATAYPEFTLIRNAEVKDLIFEGGRVVGVRTPELDVRAELVVAADGRKSAVRAAAGLETASQHSPMDVLWFRLKWRPGDPQELFAIIRKGLLIAMIYRGDYWQVAYLMPKGANPQDGSLEAFKQRLVSVRPQLREHVNDLRSWDDTSHLDVRVDRLKTWWRTGLLCVLATPRMPCHRPVGSASTSPLPMRWPQPTSSTPRCAKVD